jgi:hypothetical protein
MCDPISLIVAGSVASAGAGVAGAIGAKKDRKRAARTAKDEANEQRRLASIENRKARSEDFETRRAGLAAQGDYGASPFSPRSFFAGA